MLNYYFNLAIGRLLHTPLLALLMIFSLAIGIAASMTTATLRYVLGQDPIPSKSERLLNLQNPSTSYMGDKFSYTDAKALSRLSPSDTSTVIFGAGITTALSIPGRHETIPQGVGVRYATPDFFHMFNVPLEHGRIWTHAEERNAAPVAVLNEETARDLFGRSSAIGKQLRIGGTQYTVIGLTGYWNPRPRYYDLDNVAGAFGGGGDAIFLPVTTMQYAPDNLMVSRSCPDIGRQPTLSSPPQLLSSSCRWLSVWYLAHTPESAKVLSQTLKSRLPQVLSVNRARELRLMNVRQIMVNADVVPAPVRLYFMLGMAFLVLCVVNASGMQLSRVLRSSSQIGIRRALGANRMDIVKQYLCDALMISSIGGILGVGMTFLGLYAVRHLPGVYYTDMARMDGVMFILMVVLVVVCGALVGVIPAWLASRSDPALLIKVPQ